MKSLHITAAMLTASAVFSLNCVFAAAASLSAGTEIGSAEYTYSADGIESGTDSVLSIFDFTDIAPGETGKSELEVTSSSQDELEVYLKLVVNEGENSYKQLDRYSFKITDTDGNVIYDSADSEPAAPGEVSKNIPLGSFNSQFVDDTKKFIVEYTLNTETEISEQDGDAGFDMILTSQPVQTETNEPTQEPLHIEANVSEPREEAVSADSSAGAGETATADPNLASKIKTKVCGKDIDPGKYTVSGNGKVIIADKNGILLGENVVTDGTIDGVDGVRKFSVTLHDGDVIVIAPVGGMEKATVKFENVSSGSDKPNTAVSSQTSDKDSSAKTPKKTNPKTGDTAKTAAGAAAALMLLSGAGIVGIEAVKNKKNS